MPRTMRDAPDVMAAYLSQPFSYFSESKDLFLVISEMHPVHAGNAATKLIHEADEHAMALSFPRHMTLAMIRTPLVQALIARSEQS